MSFKQMHLNKSGLGMASKTACGRNVVRTPLSTNWEGFKQTPITKRCIKCAGSEHAAFHVRQDEKLAKERV